MDIGWKVASAGALAVANLLAGAIVNTGWKKVTGRKPPANGEEAATANLAEVIIFAVISGILVAVFQRMALRQTNAWYGGKRKNILAEKADELNV
ncbi:MAG: DUF4235 domain-containing protein [Actinomycetaceae bacterium]|nr:DUF4235 domain-containing protein [Actinomycetaceae bacterium]